MRHLHGSRLDGALTRVPGEQKLTEDIQTYIVQALACFDSPSTVAAEVKKEFQVEISRQLAESYDHTKRAGQKVGAQWRALFDETRKTFLEDTAQIGISHRSVRLRALHRMAERAESMSNLALAAQLHKQAAEEIGGAFTNRRELSGPGGTPIATELTVKFVGD